MCQLISVKNKDKVISLIKRNICAPVSLVRARFLINGFTNLTLFLTQSCCMSFKDLTYLYDTFMVLFVILKFDTTICYLLWKTADLVYPPTHTNHLLCSTEEEKSYSMFGMAWRCKWWQNFHCGWTIPFINSPNNTFR